MLPNPYGVITHKSSSTSVRSKQQQQQQQPSGQLEQLDVVVSGVLSTTSSTDEDEYELGVVYYSNTMGDIVSSHQYCGRGGSSSSSSSSSMSSISVRSRGIGRESDRSSSSSSSSRSSSNNKSVRGLVHNDVSDESTIDTIVSTESQVGVAISSKDLLIRMYN